MNREETVMIALGTLAAIVPRQEPHRREHIHGT
jgi:hypothetical protein